MRSYLITRTVLRKRGYRTTHEVGSLARVLSEAQTMVAKARGRVSHLEAECRAEFFDPK
jgi:hypothetical protein